MKKLNQRQILKRKLIIVKKNNFFESFGQILFNASFVSKELFDFKPFYINKYVSKYSSIFFKNALVKMKFPLQGKSFCFEDIVNYSNSIFYKKVIIVINSMFIYIKSFNFFYMYNVFIILKLLSKIFCSFLCFFYPMSLLYKV